MNELDISIGLVRQLTGSGTRWLAIWCDKFDFFDFVIADRLEGESTRESITREVAWQLDLDREREIVVSNMAQANMDFIDALPDQPFETSVRATFYNVEVYRQSALRLINEDPKNAWLTSQEIWEGTTQDGRPINPLVVYLVRRSQVIQHWESSAGNA